MKPIVLIVEDDPNVVRTWIRFLSPYDLDIRVADNLVDAKKLAHEIPPPDFLLLDLRLKGPTGEKEAAEAIPEMKKYNPHMIPIVISGFLNLDTIDMVLKQGAFLAKEKLQVVREASLVPLMKDAIAKAPKKTSQALCYYDGILKALADKAGLL